MNDLNGKALHSYSSRSYALRVLSLVFLIETLIMFFFSYFPIEDLFVRTAADSLLLILLLSPSFYFLIYMPLTREIFKRIRVEQELQEANSKLADYSHNLEQAVTEKMRELRVTDEQYKALLENSNDVIIVLNEQQEIVFWNHIAEEAFGYSREEAIGRKFSELILPEKYRVEYEEHLIRFIGTGEFEKLTEAEGLRKSGILFPMETSFSSYLSGNQKYITLIIRDITERKDAEVKIKDQLERLTALRTIDMAISSSLDLRVTLNILLDQITGSLHVDAADILLLNHNTMRLEFNAGRGFRTDALKHTRLRVGAGFAGKAAIEGRAICVSNIKIEKGEFSNSPLFHKEDFVSYCCVPMISKGNVKGVLEIFNRSHVVHDPERLAFVEALALQAAIAIDNSMMFNEVYHSNMELMLAYETTIEGWSHALDLRDKETEGHSHRVTDITLRIARAIGIKEEDLVHIRRGALLHDIGKMGIPDSILFKPGPLTEEEWAIMKKHPVYAYQMLQPIQYLRSALDIPYCHHEKWDGSGYPRGLRGEAIPIAARIFSVVDVWDALHSDRPYRPAWPLEKIKDHILNLAGKDFDPVMVDVFLKMEW